MHVTSSDVSVRPGAVIVGSGIAGLTVALELGDCTVVTRSELGAGASRWAQGGIAAALGDLDTPLHHASDTLAVSGGLGDPAVVGMIAAAAPGRVRWLQRLGADLDADADGRLVLGREAGHRRRRIVHAGGDATGAAVMGALVAAVRARRDIEVLEARQVVDLIRAGHEVVGVRTIGPHGPQALIGSAVVLATGGIGRVYSRTTNPAEATGDGLAMAVRTGAQVRDPEFVQFHPTALDSSLDPVPLLTEALRGEGARLVDASGHRFLLDIHPDAELAPRDVVARAGFEQQRLGPIYLDARCIGRHFPERFPTVFASSMAAGFDPRVEPLPVTPAQHYHVGGIATDDRGRTSLPGLYACGEVASAGLHGANRLASNSLVEGLVMGARVAESIAATREPVDPGADLEVPASSVDLSRPTDDGAIARLRTLMWRHGGVVRNAAGLTDALGEVARLTPSLSRSVTGRNLAAVAEVVLRAALAREESRGGHFRTDHPAAYDGAGTSTFLRPVAAARVPLVHGDRVREPVS